MSLDRDDRRRLENTLRELFAAAGEYQSARRRRLQRGQAQWWSLREEVFGWPPPAVLPRAALLARFLDDGEG